MDNDDEKELFRSAVSHVQPIKQKARVVKTQPKDAVFRPRSAESSECEAPLYDPPDLPLLPLEAYFQAEQFIEFYREGIQPRIQKKFRRGDFVIEARLDFHGCTRQRAYKLWQEFVNAATAAGLQHVLVIHGKGYGSQQFPILKNSLYYWLHADERVLAMCSATPAQGGTGALFVRLRRSS